MNWDLPNQVSQPVGSPSLHASHICVLVFKVQAAHSVERKQKGVKHCACWHTTCQSTLAWQILLVVLNTFHCIDCPDSAFNWVESTEYRQVWWNTQVREQEQSTEMVIYIHSNSRVTPLLESPRRVTMHCTNRVTMNSTNRVTMHSTNRVTMHGTNRVTMHGTNRVTMHGTNRVTMHSTNRVIIHSNIRVTL